MGRRVDVTLSQRSRNAPVTDLQHDCHHAGAGVQKVAALEVVPPFFDRRAHHSGERAGAVPVRARVAELFHVQSIV